MKTITKALFVVAIAASCASCSTFTPMQTGGGYYSNFPNKTKMHVVYTGPFSQQRAKRAKDNCSAYE